MANTQSVKQSAQAVIDYPADRIDLAQWLSTMTDREYQACSRAHRAAGTFREGGTFGMVNLEASADSCWFSIILPKRLQPTVSSCIRRKCVCMSSTWFLPRSRSFGRSKSSQGTPRAPRSLAESRRACPRYWVTSASSACCRSSCSWHVEEETVKFAADITRKVRAGSQLGS